MPGIGAVGRGGSVRGEAEIGRGRAGAGADVDGVGEAGGRGAGDGDTAGRYRDVGGDLVDPRFVEILVVPAGDLHRVGGGGEIADRVGALDGGDTGPGRHHVRLGEHHAAPIAVLVDVELARIGILEGLHDQRVVAEILHDQGIADGDVVGRAPRGHLALVGVVVHVAQNCLATRAVEHRRPELLQVRVGAGYRGGIEVVAGDQRGAATGLGHIIDLGDAVQHVEAVALLGLHDLLTEEIGAFGKEVVGHGLDRNVGEDEATGPLQGDAGDLLKRHLLRCRRHALGNGGGRQLQIGPAIGGPGDPGAFFHLMHIGELR